MSTLHTVLEPVIGLTRTDRLLRILEIPSALLQEDEARASRAAVAQALNMLLFEDLLQRVPAAKTYASDCNLGHRRIMHDHGAVRTVLLSNMGALPAGEEAITRILRPLGYALNGVYPLERLKMSGRSTPKLTSRKASPSSSSVSSTPTASPTNFSRLCAMSPAPPSTHSPPRP